MCNARLLLLMLFIVPIFVARVSTAQEYYQQYDQYQPRQLNRLNNTESNSAISSELKNMFSSQPIKPTNYMEQLQIKPTATPDKLSAPAKLTTEEIKALRRFAQEIKNQKLENRWQNKWPSQSNRARASSAVASDYQQETQPHAANMNQPSKMGNQNSGGKSSFDAALMAQGETAFNNSCIECHDAARSLNKVKNFSGWVATVRRMAAKDGAEISPSETRPIATYLASLSATNNNTDSTTDVDLPSGTTVFSTISLIHRVVDDEAQNGALENLGFFPEVWFGADFQPGAVLSGRVNMCVTCHSDGNVGSRVELAEGFLRVDLDQLMTTCTDCNVQANMDAGRFIVPFGAFASKSHPGAFRTATRPLIYNMGQNVYRDDLGPPLLPMPYSDEGAMLSGSVTLFCETTATIDAYAINGLQGSTGLDLAAFFQSREYVDNNSEPAFGGRVTIGNKTFRGGASLMSGRYNADFGFNSDKNLTYKLWGGDFTAKWGDRFRFTAEYARRDNDALNQFVFPVVEVFEKMDGYILEGELKVWDKPRISLVFRYDEQRRLAGLPINGSAIASGTFNVQRITSGINFSIAGSTLMINHERWKLPAELNDLDVLAMRWVAAF